MYSGESYISLLLYIFNVLDNTLPFLALMLLVTSEVEAVINVIDNDIIHVHFFVLDMAPSEIFHILYNGARFRIKLFHFSEKIYIFLYTLYLSYSQTSTKCISLLRKLRQHYKRYSILDFYHL